jgi:hypothetical protein
MQSLDCIELLRLSLASSELDHVMPYLEVSQSKLQEMFACVL